MGYDEEDTQQLFKNGKFSKLEREESASYGNNYQYEDSMTILW